MELTERQHFLLWEAEIREFNPYLAVTPGDIVDYSDDQLAQARRLFGEEGIGQ